MIKQPLILSLSIALLSHNAMALSKPLQDQAIWPAISAHCEKPLSPSSWRPSMPVPFDTYQKIAIRNRSKCIEQYYLQKNQVSNRSMAKNSLSVVKPSAQKIAMNYSTTTHVDLKTNEINQRKTSQQSENNTIKHNKTTIHWY